MKKTTKKKAQKEKYEIKVVIDKNMKTHENDPFFVEKAERAKKLIEKYPLPEALRKK